MDKASLYLVATPIGNLDDLSPRAIEILRSVDFILCEDTRHSGRLLKEMGISKKLMSYHDHNEQKRSQEVLDLLESGQDIALISDAGTPSISDPGTVLVDLAHERGIRIVPIPGPSAAIAAVSASGFAPGRFQFLGFLPKKRGQKLRLIEDTISYPGQSILYESPKRLRDTLELIAELCPARRVLMAREMTKLNEEFVRLRVEDLIKELPEKPRGEIVLVLDEYYREEDLDLEAELRKKLDAGLSPSRAAKDLAEEFNISRNDAYELSIKISNRY